MEIVRDKWSGVLGGRFRDWLLRMRRDHENDCDLGAIAVVLISSYPFIGLEARRNARGKTERK